VRRLALTAAALLACLATGAAGAATEWRTYGGGPRRLFFNPAETTIDASNVGRLRVRWTFPTGAVVTASPSVAVLDVPGEGPTQIAFIASWDGNLYALRTRDGSELWHFHMAEQPAANYPNAASADVRQIDGAERVLIAGGETVYSLDAVSGAEVWHFQAGTGCGEGMPPGLCSFTGERNEVESSPIVAGGLVLFGMDVNGELGNGGFLALDAHDGHLVWYFDLESGTTCRPAPGDDVRRFDGYHSEAELGLPAGFLASRPGCNFDRTGIGCGNVWSSAAVDEMRGLLYFDSGNCETDTDPSTPAPPPPMPSYDEAIVALHLDGTPAWRWRPRDVDPTDLDFGATPNLFTIDFGGAPRDVVGVGGKDGTYYVIDRDGVNAVSGVRWDDADPSGLPYWRRQVVPGGEDGGIIGTPAVDEAAGRIYIGTAPGLDTDLFTPQRPTVHALDASSGTIVWENTAEPDADSTFAPMSAIPGVVFVGKTVGGSVRAYDAATGALLGSFPVGFTLAAAPAVVDGLVIVGAGSGQVGYDPNDEANKAAHTPQPVTALCVPGTADCDEDEDGFFAPADCNDRDASINPAARDVPDNAVDENCDGLLARSRDRCDQGGSAPDDARALAAVRTAAAVACPCDAFDGSKGHTRRRYQQCVRRAMAHVAGTAELRKGCRPEALRELRTTTCGVSGAVVCCEMKAPGGPPHPGACRIRPATKCTSSPKVVRHDCSPATACADTLCAAQGICSE
jgi:polyvinyl alcohol dehydrogenase (cytochrome)